MSMLDVENITSSYGNIKAIHGVSFSVEKNSIVSLIGANGAGKSTTLKTVSGIIRPNCGSIKVLGEEITKKDVHEVARMGIAHVPEGRQVFARMTVFENMEMGAYLETDKARMRNNVEMVYDYFPVLKDRASQKAGTLSGGEQQMLAMGRALMSNPQLLLLDEPSMGLAPMMVSQIFEIIKRIEKDGKTIILVEQNANMALSIADYAYVIENGMISFHGKPDALLGDEKIRNVYLGIN